MNNLPNKKYYTLEDLAKYFNVSTEYIKKFVKDGTIKTVNMGQEYMLIPKKDFQRDTKQYLEWILRDHMNKIDIKQSTKADRIRGLLVELFIIVIIPIFTMSIYTKIGGDFAETELGNYIMIGLIILSALIGYLGYKILFEKYSDDLPEPFF